MTNRVNLSKSELTELYINQDKSAAQIGREIGHTHVTIIKYLKKHNIPIKTIYEAKSKYKKDETFFNNGQNAYWAGFIAADGCITLDKYGNPSLEIMLSRKDSEILETFKKTTRFTGKITYRDNTVKIKIHNCRPWISDLYQYWNITHNKSLTLQPPNITDLNLCLEYIIGYIDGDGSIGLTSSGKSGYKYLGFGISGTKDLLSWIADTLHKIEDTEYIVPKPRNGSGNVYQIGYKNKRARNLLEQLNNIDIPFKLSRKWNKVNAIS